MPNGWYVSPDDVALCMLDWFAGKRRSAPYGAHFECSAQVVAGLKIDEPRPEPEWSPFTLGAVGSFAELTGLPIVTRDDLGDGEWQLTAPIAASVRGGAPFGVARQVVCEGNTQDGKPTALDRAYWDEYWS